ncbi:putative sh2 domain containing protein [Operophtera brumata]|uniref:Putative sh2 domain containing protein n=1 Tax=Operophtera brumata TaxID=104452 RepID=A0A0L7KJD3_OPEBR|nr:putative sh2 domain containing protein [Operophtera brumata]
MTLKSITLFQHCTNVLNLRSDPEKYLQNLKRENKDNKNESDEIDLKIIAIEEDTVTDTVEKEIELTVTIEQETKMSIECQYQTVKKTKDDNLNFSNVDEIIKRIVPAKSFLYRNQGKKAEVTSYLPMDACTPKKRKIFRLSGYDYPNFDLKRFSKPEGDRGYYPMKRNSRFFIQKTKAPESRPKYKSISTTEELKYPEDHFYEDLCYNDIENDRNSTSSAQVKPYRVKIQELFQSFKMPFFRRSEEVFEEVKKEEVEERRIVVNDKEPMYENSDSMANMYDSVHVHIQDDHEKEVKKVN